MAHVAGAAVVQRVVGDEALGQRIGGGRQVAPGAVDEVRAQHQHHRGFPPARVRVLGKGAALGVAEQPAELGLDPVEEAAGAELPHEPAGEGGHADAVATRDGRRRLVEGGQVGGPGVAVGHEDVAEAGPGEGLPEVDDGVADDTLAHGDGADGVEREGAQVQRGRQHGRPPRPLRGQPMRDLLGEVARGEGVDAEGQMGPVLLQGADGEEDDGALAIERVERRHGQLLEPMNAHAASFVGCSVRTTSPGWRRSSPPARGPARR